MDIIKEIKNKALNSRLTIDSFWALFGNISAKGLALIAGILVARFLGSEVYGEFGLIKTTLMSLALFSTLGLGFTSTKFIAEYKLKNPEYIFTIIKYSKTITFVISSLLAFFLFFNSAYISKEILEASHLNTPLKLVSAWLVFNALTTTQIGILSGLGKFKSMAKINIVIGSCTFIFSVLFTYYFALMGALFALLLVQIINFLLFEMLIIKFKSNFDYPKIISDYNLFKKIFNFSTPVALQQGSYALSSWLYLFILMKFSGYQEVGIYSVATHWGAIVLFIPGVLYNVILTHLTEVKDQASKFDRIIKINLLFNLIATSIPFLLISMLSNIIENFYGTSFDGLNSVIILTVFSVIIYSLSDVYAQVYLSKNKNWLMFYLKFSRDVGILLLTYYLFSMQFEFRGAIILILSKIFWSIIFLILIVLIYEYHIKEKK